MPRPVGEASRRVLVCQGAVCRERGGIEARHEWLLAARGRSLVVVPTACLRFCVQAPVSIVYPDLVWLPRLTGDRVREVLRAMDRGWLENVAGAIVVRSDGGDGPGDNGE